jgi:hypothetical protein
MSVQAKMGIEMPVLVMLTLLGVAGYALDTSKDSFDHTGDHLIDRDSLVLPEILVENADQDSAEILRPAFDAIWNAAGFPRCAFYDDDGKRIQR